MKCFSVAGARAVRHVQATARAAAVVPRVHGRGADGRATRDAPLRAPFHRRRRHLPRRLPARHLLRLHRLHRR